MTNDALTEFDLLTEKQKENDDNLIREFDRLISNLVYRKDHLKKAYNYYNGVYDEDQYKYLADVYGMQTPTTVDFIPVVRTHIDKLIGEFLNDDINPSGVTCKDSETLSNINAEKKAKINQEVLNLYQTQLSAALKSFIEGVDQSEDIATPKHIKKLIEDIDRDFISEYEISVKNVLEFLKNSNDIKLKEKLKILFLDILVSGQCYYSVTQGRSGETPSISVHSPFDVFVKKSYNEIEVNRGTASVVRKWGDRREILMNYGRYMKKADLIKLDRYLIDHGTEADVYYVRSSNGGLVQGGIALDSKGSAGDRRDENYEPVESVFPIYEVERLATNEVTLEDGSTDYRVDRYSGIRIGEDLYIALQKDDDVMRTRTRPLEARLSLNGITFDDRAKKPYSLVLLTADLQDKYNLLNFHRDHYISTSGTKGDFLDIATLPLELGDTLPERIAKWTTYKKSGTALINTSQEGIDGAGSHNTQYVGFDDTVQHNSIQAIELAMQSTLQTISSITGVFQEALGSYSEKDAVTNVQTGIKMSAIVTKQYFFMLNGVVTSLLIDAVNACKVSFRNGFVGSYVLGNKLQKVFTIEPQYFSFTDYDIHLVDLGKHAKDLESMQNITLELVSRGDADVDILLDLIGAESLTAAKANVGNAIRRSREENNQLEQMNQQMQEMQKALQQAQKEADDLAKQLEQAEKKANEVARAKLDYDYEIAKEKNEIEKAFKENQAINTDKRTQLEELQMYDNNPYNNTVKS